MKKNPKLLTLLLVIGIASCKKEMKPESPANQREVTRSNMGGNYWTQIAIPVTNPSGGPSILEGNSTFSVNNKLYVALAGYNQLWQYDPTTSQWTLKQQPFFNFQLTIGDAHYVFTYGNSVYFLNTSTKIMRQFDLSTAQWSNKANFPGSASLGVSSAFTTTKGYILGGGTSTDYSTVANTVAENWEYDFVADTWIAKTSTPGLSRYNAAAYAVGDKVYFGTGISFRYLFNPINLTVTRNPIIDADWWEYNTTTGIWTQKATYGGGTRQDTRGFVIGGTVYVGMGSAGYFTDLRSDLWAYNPGSDTWSQSASYPPGNGYPPYISMASADGYGFALTEDISACWIYTPPYTIFFNPVLTGTAGSIPISQP